MKLMFLHRDPSAFLALFVSALAVCAGFLATAASGKTQHLTSPEQVPEGLANSDWSSIREAYEAGRHAFMPIEGGWQARNPGQRWITKFDRRGFMAQPREAEWEWGLELKSYGFAGQEIAISGVPEVKAQGHRLSYDWDSIVQEWFGLHSGRSLPVIVAQPANAWALAQEGAGMLVLVSPAGRRWLFSGHGTRKSQGLPPFLRNLRKFPSPASHERYLMTTTPR
jgi:hypothetical protein